MAPRITQHKFYGRAGIHMLFGFFAYEPLVLAFCFAWAIGKRRRPF